MENINKTTKKKKSFFIERFSTFSFLTLLPIVALMILVGLGMILRRKIKEILIKCSPNCRKFFFIHYLEYYMFKIVLIQDG